MRPRDSLADANALPRFGGSSVSEHPEMQPRDALPIPDRAHGPTVYGPHDNAFTGEVSWVQIHFGEDAQDADHMIAPEDRVAVALARQ
jgi:hypothetical protein